MGSFRLVVITPESTSATESGIVRGMFDRGLQTLHVRKPGASADEVAAYLAALPPAHRRRCMLHSHHQLSRKTAVQGIHFTANQLPGIVRSPPGLAVSTSFHTLAELGICRGEVDYCFLSPVYESISKAGAQGCKGNEGRQGLQAAGHAA